MYPLIEAICSYVLVILGAIDWAVAVNTVATAVIALATILIWKSNKLATRIAAGGTMPILNFRVDRKEPPAWIIENIGKGVALNVWIAHEKLNGKVDEPVRDYNALRPERWYRIIWKDKPFKFVAQYTGVYEKRYTCVCARNVNNVLNGWLYEDWDKKKKKPLWLMVVDGEIKPDEDSLPKGT